MRLTNDWHERIGDEFCNPYFLQLERFLEEEYAKKVVYPSKENIFNALHFTPFQQVKVVMLGQDPYHGANQAHGLSFSVNPGIPQPPSLRNIFKELKEDLGYPIPNHGYLKKWAEEGVLLLNTVLTVREGEAHSHQGQGWEIFTDRIIEELNRREKPVIFLLWGKPAQGKKKLINSEKHKVIASTHPSPLSAYRGFFGSKPFSKVNKYLREMGQQEIDWRVEDM